MPPASKNGKAPPEWAVALVAETETLRTRRVRDLSVSERFTLARYHALRFANCTTKEAANKRRAVDIASGLKTLVDTDEYHDIPVSAYLRLAEDCWEKGGRAPFYRPWLIRSVDEVEA